MMVVVIVVVFVRMNDVFFCFCIYMEGMDV